MPPPPFSDHPEGVEIALLIQPRAARTRVVGEHGGMLKIQLQAPPVDGAANKALVAFLAKALGVARADVELCAGQRGRRKRVRVRGATVDAARAALIE